MVSSACKNKRNLNEYIRNCFPASIAFWKKQCIIVHGTVRLSIPFPECLSIQLASAMSTSETIRMPHSRLGIQAFLKLK